MNVMLEAALAYARMRWRIFPCHSIVEGGCSCGKAKCTSPGKHPRTKQGFRDATDDISTITGWWKRWPNANIALATGSGLVAIDLDGKEGFHEFKALVEANVPPPATLVAQTGRGAHLLYRTPPDCPEVRSSARGNVHVRGEGGYIIVAPSNHISGNNYKWIRKEAVALIPVWLRQWSQGYEISKEKTGKAIEALGPVPAYVSSQLDSRTNVLSDQIKVEYSAHEHARLASALSAIPADQYDSWTQVGMALKTLDWERSDGSSIAFDLFDQWSRTCPEKYAFEGCQWKWNSFGRRAGVTLGTVFHLARERGWNGGAPAPGEHKNGMNGHSAVQALPAAFTAPKPIFFPDQTEEGQPRITCTNAGVAVTGLGVLCNKDLFHEKAKVGGEMIDQWAGELSDDVVQMLRKVIRAKFGFDPGEKNTRDACIQLCLENQFDPILDYLDSLVWDGAPRLDTWMARYMGAVDSELTRAIGRLSLIAAVRRARVPGTKFDQIIVLEGVEGRGKSSALEILAGSDNFSDQKILGLGDREQQEATTGVWLFEIGELTGMRKAEVEHIKAFASRTVDRARPAYGRFRVDRPRRTIFFATTNRQDYLQSDTGNRRFWPVSTGAIDLAALRRDRDQLWAEAAMREARGDSIVLPESLWFAAAEQQDARMQGDDWLELIERYIVEKKLSDVSATQVLCDNQYIQRRPDAVTSNDYRRVARIMKQLNWDHRKMRVGGSVVPVSRYLKRD